jgi:hypothetical protein
MDNPCMPSNYRNQKNDSLGGTALEYKKHTPKRHDMRVVSYALPYYMLRGKGND